jgi:hypothetical protein
MYNLKCLSLFIISLVLVGCGGGTSTTSAPTAPTLTMSFAPTKIFRFNWVAVSGATSYKLKEAITTGSGYTVINETTTTSFDHVVPLYGRLNAKYIVESCNATGCTASTAVFTSTKVAEMASSIGYLKASNTGTAADKYFGVSVSLSSDGNTLAVGASGEDSSATGVNGDQTDNSVSFAGAVYVFSRTGTVWTQQAYLKASNPDVDDIFGYRLSLSADGNTLAVGAANEDSNATGINGDQTDNSMSDSGAVYIFSRTGAIWSHQAYLKSSNTGASDYFGGQSVSLSADGNTLAVGAANEDSNATTINGDQTDNSTSDSGAVYVFTRTGTTWTQQAYIKASNAEVEDYFGLGVSLSSNGNTLAISAPDESSNATGIGGDQTNNSAADAGAIYVFTRDGTTWSQQAYIKASNTEAYDYFGQSLSLSADSNTLAVGAYGESSNANGINGAQADNSLSFSGAVYVFTRAGTTWSQQAYVKASNTGANDIFGRSVSLSNSGNTLAVGAHQEGSSATGLNGEESNNSEADSGAVYVLTRSGTTWSQSAYVKANNTAAAEYYGNPVSLSADGAALAVGATYEDSNATGVNGDQTNNSTLNAGAVYLY